jgi:hypothetical protein
MDRASARIGDDDFVSLVDLTHGRALVRLTGDDASRVLSTLCGIDLADEVTPNLRAFRSSVAKVVTDVVRDDFDAPARTCCTANDRQGSTCSTCSSTLAPSSDSRSPAA